jgi:PrtD family type I secretion system ABC transporter
VTVRKAIAKSWFAFLGVGIFSAVINALVLTGSFYMLQVYDRVLPSRSVPTLIGITVLLVVLYAAYGALDFARVRVLSRIGLGIDRQLRASALRAEMLLPLRSKVGGEAIRPVRDLDQIRNFFSGLGPTALFDMPWLPVYIALIYCLHPVLGLFAIGAGILLVSLTLMTEARTKKPAHEAAKSGIVRQSFSDATRRNAEVLKAMGLAGRAVEKWDILNEKYLADQLAMSDASNGIGAASKVLRLLLQSGILGLGAYLTIEGELSAGSLIACSVILSRSLAPIEIAISHWKSFVAMRQSFGRLNKLLSSMPSETIELELPRPTQFLSASDLFVAPPGEVQPIIQGVTFRLEAGDGLGIIGPSASGKSTLVRALAGVWSQLPRGGHVRLDGATLDQWTEERIGRDVGYLPQDIELFDGSIAENIARLDKSAAAEHVIAAAKLAGIHDMIIGMPEGYSTRIGDGGVKLSAGQRQRVALARALYGDPFLVILDEPNSNLDTEGDMALTSAIRSVRERNGIVLVVAHRPSALAGLDKVLALYKGRARAFGPKDEVLKSVMKPVSVEPVKPEGPPSAIPLPIKGVAVQMSGQ